MGKERYKSIAASYLVLIKDNKVLLLRRFNTGYEDGNYSVPAGHVDEGESFTECLIREVKEEISLDLNPENIKVAHILHRYTTPNNERIEAFFTAEKWEGEIKNMEPEKCDDLSWFDSDNLPENIIPYIAHAIKCIKNKISYSEYGWELRK